MIQILQWDMLGTFPYIVKTIDGSDSFVPYNSKQTLWRVINDFDIIARVPVTPSTLLNGGTGSETHLLMQKGVIKVQSLQRNVN